MGATTWATARGLLRPRPSPRLMPTPTCCTEDTVWDTTATGPTATPTPTDTTARGLLMPSPRPSPTTTVDTTVATPVPTTVDTLRSLLGIDDDPRHPDLVLATTD